MLSGGAGDDTIYIGNNDVARGGDGDDEFIVGDWMEDGALSEITASYTPIPAPADPVATG